MRHIKMVGFWLEDLKKLVDHLKATGYDEEEIKHLEDIVKAEEK